MYIILVKCFGNITHSETTVECRYYAFLVASISVGKTRNTMNSKVMLLIAVAMAVISVAIANWPEEVEMDEEDDEALTVEDVEEYLIAKRNGAEVQNAFEDDSLEMEKRRRRKKKVGKCKLPNGDICEMCNLKIKNKNDMRRYVACQSAGKGRSV